MPINRFYTPKVLHESEKIVMTGSEARHISRVLRKVEGDLVELTNGAGTLAVAAIGKISPQQIELVVKRSQTIKKCTPEMILVQPLLHKSKLEWIIEKATELGVDQFWFFTAKQGLQKTLSVATAQRFDSIIISASKQCGRVWFPKIHSYLSLKDIPVPFSSTCYFGTIDQATPPIAVPSSQTDPVILFVGPESGWADEELTILQDQFQAIPFVFNKNVLRAETASVSGMAILQYLYRK
ncbi:MAG: RsmE family RNA methyltransferase [Chlamydiales bacterium]